jgi:hypothetical protein
VEISFEADRPWLVGLLVATLLLGFGVLGHFVSPVEAGRPVLLTWDRWEAVALERQVRAETDRLVEDMDALRNLLAPPGGASGTTEEFRPDAIKALTLAQRIYTRQREGAAVTAPARQAAITAAETAARHAAGGVERAAAVDAVNEALGRLQALTPVEAAR